MDSATRYPFVITSAIVGFITLFVAFNLEIITSFAGRFYSHWRDKIVRSMRSDDRWKEKGEELQDSNPTQTRPSEWWLLGYIVHRSIGWLTGQARQSKKTTAKVDSGNAC